MIGKLLKKLFVRKTGDSKPQIQEDSIDTVLDAFDAAPEIFEDGDNYIIHNVGYADMLKLSKVLLQKDYADEYQVVNLADLEFETPEEATIFYLDVNVENPLTSSQIVGQLGMLRARMNARKHKVLFLTNATDEQLDAFYQEHVKSNRRKRLPNTDYIFMNASTKYLKYENAQIVNSNRNGFG